MANRVSKTIEFAIGLFKKLVLLFEFGLLLFDACLSRHKFIRHLIKGTRQGSDLVAC